MTIRARNIIFILISITHMSFGQQFKQEQRKFSRVKTAYKEKEAVITKLLGDKNIRRSSLHVLIRIFKEEKLLEVWAKDNEKKSFLLLTTYKICSSSGEPGPKRKEGDGQVPEGFYYVSCFNPNSNFYLSLGVSYPNASDKILSDKNHPGGAICIHGNCVTIGCIPITDDKIKELYILAVEAKNNGQTEVPIYIFPCRMEEKIYENLKKQNSGDTKLIEFWNNIKTGYDFFEKGHNLPVIKVDSKGKYIFK
jgi:murein L,D-transpeptidase YafK